VGGFRLALEGYAPAGLPSAGGGVTWSDQWEPGTRRQHASDCYLARFGPDEHHNEDIAVALDHLEADRSRLSEIDLVVGGFPCQDYSVARVLPQAAGIVGKKGVLWWEIHRFVRLTRPRLIFLENVDRLLRSPAHQRGRDFGVMLACLADLGYVVEWRVVNAADYGFPQRRRRTFIVAHCADPLGRRGDPLSYVLRDGVLARALPAGLDDTSGAAARGKAELSCVLLEDLVELSDRFAFDFQHAGVMRDRRVWTYKVRPEYAGPRAILGDVLVPEGEVPSEYVIPKRQVPKWRYLKGAKREPRTVARNGFRYHYSEGALPFPDPLDRPSRTILTGEGGSSPSRFKHVVETPSGRYRRLVPTELERLNGFPDGWTATGMPEPRRAFCMGNALVVGLVHRIALELGAEHGVATLPELAVAQR